MPIWAACGLCLSAARIWLEDWCLAGAGPVLDLSVYLLTDSLCVHTLTLCVALWEAGGLCLGLAGYSLKEATCNWRCNTTPRQLGPQWGGFFRICPFCVSKHYLRANKMWNLGCSAKRMKMYKQAAKQQQLRLLFRPTAVCCTKVRRELLLWSFFDLLWFF